MVRPLRFETARYGEYSKAGEFVYDHPFLWGSKRTGPDLHREGIGNKQTKSDSWHYLHMEAPDDISPGSIMPAYAFLLDDDLDVSYTVDKITTMRKLGVPYREGYEQQAMADLQTQASRIAKSIANDLSADASQEQIDALSKKEIVALIGYLQRLGSDIHEATDLDGIIEGLTSK